MSIATQWLPPERTESWYYSILPIVLAIWSLFRVSLGQDQSSSILLIEHLSLIGLSLTFLALLLYESGIDEWVVKKYYRRRSPGLQLESERLFLFFNMYLESWTSTGENIPILNSEDHSISGQVNRMYQSVVSGIPVLLRLSPIRKSLFIAISSIFVVDIILGSILTEGSSIRTLLSTVTWVSNIWDYFTQESRVLNLILLIAILTSSILILRIIVYFKRYSFLANVAKSDPDKLVALLYIIPHSIYFISLIISVLSFIQSESSFHVWISDWYFSIWLTVSIFLIIILIEVNGRRHRNMKNHIQHLVSLRFLQTLVANTSLSRIEEDDGVIMSESSMIPRDKLELLSVELRYLDSILSQKNWTTFVDRWRVTKRNLTKLSFEKIKIYLKQLIRDEWNNHKEMVDSKNDKKINESARELGWLIHYARESLILIEHEFNTQPELKEIEKSIRKLYKFYKWSIYKNREKSNDEIISCRTNLPKDLRKKVEANLEEYAKLERLVHTEIIDLIQTL